MNNVWQSLKHNKILNIIEETIGDKLTNLLIQRNSYINRVFELEKVNKERIIVKFYRPGRWTKEMIGEEHALLVKLAENDIPVIEPINFNGSSLFLLDGISFAVFPKKGGRALDEFNKESWLEIGRMIARMHSVSETFDKSQRVVWRPAVATRQHLDILLQGDYLPFDFKSSLKNIVELFIEKADPLFKNEQLFLIHGDCHKGNLIHRPGEGTFIVDFDDISVGPAVQDLWMLLPDVPEESEQEINWFVEGYETFRDFNDDSLKLVPALKVMRIIHFAGWCALQSSDVDFDKHFSEWGSIKYWNELIRDVQELVFRL
jgi:Ser/Thr protein kinase RdoA (MazF antagonist)